MGESGSGAGAECESHPTTTLTTTTVLDGHGVRQVTLGRVDIGWACPSAPSADTLLAPDGTARPPACTAIAAARLYSFTPYLFPRRNTHRWRALSAVYLGRGALTPLAQQETCRELERATCVSLKIMMRFSK